MKIVIETIPYSEMKYPTCGDYWESPDGTWQIRVADLGNWKREVAIALHELWEKALCKSLLIRDEVITNFDIEFEKKRVEGNLDEPGDDPKSPYNRQHCSATGIERLFISSVGENWKDYEQQIQKL